MIRTIFAWFVVALLCTNLGLALSLTVINYTANETRYMENFMWFTVICYFFWGVKND